MGALTLLASVRVGPVQFDEPIWLVLIPVGWALAVWIGWRSIAGLGMWSRRAALIVAPFLDLYRTEGQLGNLTLVDAFYYAGVTITVLGYGDITPLTGPLKILTFVGSASGFALLTRIVAYMIEIVATISERNKFAFRVVDESGGSSGIGLILLGSTLLVIAQLRAERVRILRRLDATPAETSAHEAGRAGGDATDDAAEPEIEPDLDVAPDAIEEGLEPDSAEPVRVRASGTGGLRAS